MLGTNGGGFFKRQLGAPVREPNGFTNFFEMLLVLIIPASLVFTYGRMVGSRRQSLAIFAAMFVMFFGGVTRRVRAERTAPRRSAPPVWSRRARQLESGRS